MINYKKLYLTQIETMLPGRSPKVRYYTIRSVCWVVKHVRRQFLRTGAISEQVRKGVRKAVLKLHYHPFFQEFIDQYPEIFDPKEKETLCRPSTDCPRPSVDLPGGGGGGGGGNVFGTQNLMETLEENASFGKNQKKPTRHPKTVSDFVEEIKKSKAYSHLNIDEQIEKIKIWLLKPENKGKQLTSARILNWLNKEPKPLEVSDGKPPTDVVKRRLWELEQDERLRSEAAQKNS